MALKHQATRMWRIPSPALLICTVCAVAAAAAWLLSGPSAHGSDSVAPEPLGRATLLPRRALMQFGQVAYVGQRWPWQLNSITGYFATPEAAGSATVAADAKFEVFRDGTAKLGAGASFATAFAQGRDSNLPLGTNPRYDRPLVSTQAYVAVPQLLGWTTFPTFGYSLAEARGTTLSTSNGYFVVGELAYNGLSNTFGVSLSQAQASSLNVPALQPGSGLFAGQGFSGIEQVGVANSLTLLTDPRTNQFAQGVAYPFNILTPFNPLTCTQTMIGSLVTTWGDLGGPVRPTPRNQPLFLIPFCAEFFNPQVLDNSRQFLQAYLDYYYNYDEAYYQDYGTEEPGQDGYRDGLETWPPPPSAPPAPAGSQPCPLGDTSCEPLDTAPNALDPATLRAGLGQEAAQIINSTNSSNSTESSNSTASGNTTAPVRSPPEPAAVLRDIALVQPPSPGVPVPGDTRPSPGSSEGTATATATAGGGQQPPDQGASSSPPAVAVADLLQAGFGQRFESGGPSLGPPLSSEEVAKLVATDTPEARGSPPPAPANVAGRAGVEAAPAAPRPPAPSVARPPTQLLPQVLRQSPLPRPEDVAALVKIGQVVAEQLGKLPAGRLVRGVASEAALSAAGVLANVTADATEIAQQAWNITNQLSWLGAETALSAFMSSASALLPITRLVYNNSAARYAAAAAASNRRVDQAIAGLQGIAEQAGQGAANAASSIQRLSSIAAKSAKESLGEG